MWSTADLLEASVEKHGGSMAKLLRFRAACEDRVLPWVKERRAGLRRLRGEDEDEDEEDDAYEVVRFGEKAWYVRLIARLTCTTTMGTGKQADDHGHACMDAWRVSTCLPTY